MKAPTVHINGTSRESLTASLEAAVGALREAIGAVCGCAPNARDYYLQGPGAIEQATTEHLERLRKLREVREELCKMWEGIANA